MRKLKFQGGLTKMYASKLGERNKKNFAIVVNQKLHTLRQKLDAESTSLNNVSFSSYNDFYEQVLSILSFLRYVGTPRSWIVYSDGSHTSEQIQILTTSFEFIKVKITNWSKDDCLRNGCKQSLLPYMDNFLHYAKLHPLGKKLFLYLNHEVNEPTLFLDSDILFYEQASILNSILKEKVNGWFLPDESWGCLDSNYKANNQKQLYQVNSGFLLFGKNLSNVLEGLDFFRSMNFKYEYFSEQTIFHILLRANAFLPFDPRIFILSTKDQFDLSYLYTKDQMAIRHYSGPVRHKMWQRDWKWHLSISKLDYK